MYTDFWKIHRTCFSFSFSLSKILPTITLFNRKKIFAGQFGGTSRLSILFLKFSSKIRTWREIFRVATVYVVHIQKKVLAFALAPLNLDLRSSTIVWYKNAPSFYPSPLKIPLKEREENLNDPSPLPFISFDRSIDTCRFVVRVHVYYEWKRFWKVGNSRFVTCKGNGETSTRHETTLDLFRPILQFDRTTSSATFVISLDTASMISFRPIPSFVFFFIPELFHLFCFELIEYETNERKFRARSYRCCPLVDVAFRYEGRDVKREVRWWKVRVRVLVMRRLYERRLEERRLNISRLEVSAEGRVIASWPKSLVERRSGCTE